MAVHATSVAEALDQVLDVDPHRVAVVGPSGQLTYQQLDEAANAAAALFSELGTSRGDRIAASLPNDLDIVVAFHGAMRLGAIWVGVNSALAPPEKETLLQVSGASLLLTEPRLAADLSMPSSAKTVHVEPGDAQSDWHSGLEAFRSARHRPPPAGDAPAAIAYTSGTTGLPRGIVHSQRNLLLPASSLVASRHYDAGLRKGDCLPLTILNLIVLSTLLTAAAGGCCVLTERRDARGIAEWIYQHSVNVWNGVPALLHSMVYDEELDVSLLLSLREVWTGGAGCPEELLAAFRDRFGAPVCATYGLTEAPTIVTIDPVDGSHVPGASGVPLPHLDVRSLDDGDESLPPGVQGEITVRGATDGPWRSAYTPMLGYWNDHGLEPIQERELRTGDLGWLDEHRYLFVRDRKKLIIMRGGANVYPAEVERVLSEAPGVRDSAVIGIPDARLGQRVAAAVEVIHPGAATENDLREHCLRRLARYKVPERIALAEVLPRNAMGKVQRVQLTELFALEEEG